MKMTVTMKMTLGCLAGFLCFNAMAEDPAIVQVSVRQRWPWSRLVDIDYVLSCDPTQKVDIAVSGYNGSVPLSLPAKSLSGDLFGVSEGARRIIFDPTKTAYTNYEVMSQFRVALAPTDTRLYMIVDLTLNADDAGQVTYVTKSDLAGGVYGTVETNPVAGVNSVVWTGVTNNSIYKDQKLVLRRIHSGSVTNLSNQTIAVEKDFFVSVFELTQNQWYRIKGSYPACLFGAKNGPVEKVSSYDVLRGSVSEGINWPTTGNSVATNSFLALVRAKTGFSGFDLPDNNQWQYACRAGTSTIYNDNNYAATDSETNGTNVWLHVLGCYKGNAGNKTAVVGSFKPNAWGLYDMHGNVLEWTLNYYSGSSRTRRGGSYYYNANQCTSVFAKDGAPADADGYGLNGVRLIINLN